MSEERIFCPVTLESDEPEYGELTAEVWILVSRTRVTVELLGLRFADGTKYPLHQLDNLDREDLEKQIIEAYAEGLFNYA